MLRSLTIAQVAAIFAVAGSFSAAFIPAFVRNLSASKMSEAIDGLDRLCTNAIAYAESHPEDISFPPSAPLTPEDVPRGVRAADPPHAWDHLTWKALDFGFDHPHAYSFEFISEHIGEPKGMRFRAVAHGDLDGDGATSTFEVIGERLGSGKPRILPGMFVDREVE